MGDPPEGDRTGGPNVISVGELNHAVARLIERSFTPLWVSGEISNLRSYASGHWYFKLKDARASVDAVMFKGRTRLLDFTPADGDQVQVRAQPSLYEAGGGFQLVVESMRPAGEGMLFRRFMQLKARLQAEGLFDEDRKRAIPDQPRCIGVVTSLQAAALRDVLTTLARRAPQVPVILYPASVQGAAAPGDLCEALARANRRAECDLLLLVRGGGSIEDLWAFNDEGLARAIVASAIPVISGVGHETDFTIADFVADWRAPTPTGAAMRAVPDRGEQRVVLERDAQRLSLAMDRHWAQAAQRLESVARLLRAPSLQWAQRAAVLERLSQGLSRLMGDRLQRSQSRLDRLGTGLRAPSLERSSARLQMAQRALPAAMAARVEQSARRLALGESALGWASPQAVLDRGYALVTDPQGRFVRDAEHLMPGQPVSVRLSRGGFDAVVNAVQTDPTKAGAD
ncbi:MAG: exodeoxyribonuclease VII large subunit [Burkholderiales bacterium]